MLQRYPQGKPRGGERRPISWFSPYKEATIQKLLHRFLVGLFLSFAEVRSNPAYTIKSWSILSQPFSDDQLIGIVFIGLSQFFERIFDGEAIDHLSVR